MGARVLGLAETASAGPGPVGDAVWPALGGGADTRSFGLPAGPDPGFWARGWAVGRTAGSQYDALRQLAADGVLPAGHLFALAGEGEGFHGQHGRPWRALRGNLHLCAVLDADLPAAAWGPALPALPAVAALEAVAGVMGSAAELGLKWVNDVLLDGRKLGGVLTAVRVRDGRIERVFLGIGVNVATAPGDVDGLPAACLAERCDRGLAALAIAVLERIAARWTALQADGPGPLVDAYRAASAVLGRRVVVRPDGPGGPGGPPRHGTAVAIGDDLALHLDDGGAPLHHGRLVLADG